MAKLPSLTSHEVIRALEQLGFQVVRQKGSHVRMRHAIAQERVATIPTHPGKTIGRGILGKILRTAAIEPDELLALV